MFIGMSKPLALPVVPIVRHPTRPAVVWAVGSALAPLDPVEIGIPGGGTESAGLLQSLL